MRGNERGTFGDENAPDPPVKSQGNGGDQRGICEGEREGRGADHGEKEMNGEEGWWWGPQNRHLSTPRDPTARGYSGRSLYPTAKDSGGRPFSTSALADGRQSPSRYLPPGVVAVVSATLPPQILAVGKGSDPEIFSPGGQIPILYPKRVKTRNFATRTV
jgi:hypothetical protein